MSEDAGSGIKVDGLDEFRKELRRAADGKTLRKEFTAEERKIAQRVAQAARALDESELDFLLFLGPDDAPRIIYRRQDGTYGLLEPNL
jgi:hypothetical protein